MRKAGGEIVVRKRYAPDAAEVSRKLIEALKHAAEIDSKMMEPSKGKEVIDPSANEMIGPFQAGRVRASLALIEAFNLAKQLDGVASKRRRKRRLAKTRANSQAPDV